MPAPVPRHCAYAVKWEWKTWDLVTREIATSNQGPFHATHSGMARCKSTPRTTVTPFALVTHPAEVADLLLEAAGSKQTLRGALGEPNA